MHNLHLGFGHAIVQLTEPKSAVLGFRKNRTVVATRLRNNRIVLIQINTPLAPTILQLFKLRSRIGQINAVTDKANVPIQRTVLVDIFGIIGTFARVLFGTVNIYRRITFVIQIIVIVIASDIGCRGIRIRRIVALFNLTFIALANPFNAFFFRTCLVVQATVMQGSRCTQVIFAVVVSVRGFTANRKVFADQTKVKVNGTHVTACHDFDVPHVAQVLVVAAVRAHNTTPRITRQVIVGTQGHLEHGQVLVINIGITHRRINILVQLRIVAVPNKFTLVSIVLILNIGRSI